MPPMISVDSQYDKHERRSPNGDAKVGTLHERVLRALCCDVVEVANTPATTRKVPPYSLTTSANRVRCAAKSRVSGLAPQCRFLTYIHHLTPKQPGPFHHLTSCHHHDTPSRPPPSSTLTCPPSKQHLFLVSLPHPRFSPASFLAISHHEP